MDKLAEYEIIKGVPPPEKYDGCGKSPYRRYPFPKMDVGDSFLVKGNVQSAVQCAINFGRRHKKKFRSQYQPDKQAIQIWRVE